MIHPKCNFSPCSKPLSPLTFTSIVTSCQVLLCPSWPSFWWHRRYFFILKYKYNHSSVHNYLVAFHNLRRKPWFLTWSASSCVAQSCPPRCPWFTLLCPLPSTTHVNQPIAPSPYLRLQCHLSNSLITKSLHHFLPNCHLFREAFLNHPI